MIVAFDFETYLIAPGRPHPRAVCMSYALIDHGPAGPYIREVKLVPAAEGIALLRQWLVAGYYFVGANTSFDVLVSVVNAPDPHGMLALWAAAYEQDRVTDVLLRQILIDLACSYRRPRYSLAIVAERHDPNIKLVKDCWWRLRFGLLDGVPVEAYPPEASAYALEDAHATAVAFIGQYYKQSVGSPLFPGQDMLANEFWRARKDLALADLAAWGMRTDAATVAALESQLTAELLQHRSALIAAGLVTRELRRNKQAAMDRVEDLGLVVGFIGKGLQISLTKPCLKASGDYLLQQYATFPDCDVDALIKAGLVTEKFKKDTKAAKALMVSTWPQEAQQIWQLWDGHQLSEDTPEGKAAIGRLRELDVKLTESFDVGLDADACTLSKHPVLSHYAAYNTTLKTLTTDVKLAKRWTSEPLHPHYDSLKETGRTGTSPNVQNMPRKPGVRECWVPRPGNVFVEADFSAVELHAFAQICYDVLGFSDTGDMLNAGIDLHLRVAAEYLQIEYEEAKRWKAEGRSEVKRARTMGKGVNFGAKGAMGPDRFVEYCWNNYGLPITRELAVKLLALHKRICREFPEYTKWIKSQQREPGKFGSKIDIVQPWSGRLRAGCGYCDAHNSPFQGLAADLAGVALWKVFRATHGLSDLGWADPLVGARLCLFVHDSIAVECPEAQAPAAALRLSELMVTAGREVLPRCPPSAAPVISRQLSKLAVALWRDNLTRQVVDEDAFRAHLEASGKVQSDFTLVPWGLYEQCAAAVAAGADLEKLRKDEWPEFVIQATLAA